MPIIRVNAPPLKLKQGISKSLERLSTEIALFTSIDEQHFTIQWQTYEVSNLISGGKITSNNEIPSPNILVDILVPDFYEKETQSKLLEACSTSINNVFGIAQEQLFVHIRLAKSGSVLDSGEIVTW